MMTKMKKTIAFGMTVAWTVLLVGTAAGQQESDGTDGYMKATAPTEQQRIGDPYPLDTCSVSGKKLGAMGDPIIKMYERREIQLCCAGCVDKFDSNPVRFIAQIDEQIIEDQTPYYPMQNCVVSGKPLIEGGEDIGVNMVYGNRLVRLCCKMCVGKFKSDSAKYMKMLDSAVVRAQRSGYPLDTCVVRGGELGAMGEPAEIVIANRLARLCCDGCQSKLETNPAMYVKRIDAAWEAKGGLHAAKGNSNDDHSSRG